MPWIQTEVGFVQLKTLLQPESDWPSEIETRHPRLLLLNGGAEPLALSYSLHVRRPKRSVGRLTATAQVQRGVGDSAVPCVHVFTKEGFMVTLREDQQVRSGVGRSTA